MSNGWKKEEHGKCFRGEVGDSGWSALGNSTATRVTTSPNVAC